MKPLRTARRAIPTLIAAVVSLQLGALAVVCETALSGITELPFAAFAGKMLPVHLAIGIVEGIATVAILALVTGRAFSPKAPRTARRAVPALLMATILLAGVFCWFASGNLDGLEWSVTRTAGADELLAPETSLYTTLASIQETTAFMPDYNFRRAIEASPVNAGTSAAGLIGALMTLLLAGAAGKFLECGDKA